MSEITYLDARTDGYRCINGESEGWPGLVVDRYATTLVLKLYTAAWLPRLDEIVSLMTSSLSRVLSWPIHFIPLSVRPVVKSTSNPSCFMVFKCLRLCSLIAP